MVVSASGRRIGVSSLLSGIPRIWLGRWLKHPELTTQGDMNPRICVCCGEPIAEEANTLSRNPNVCASCSSMADGMEESNVLACDRLAPDQDLAAEVAEKALQAGPSDKVMELAAHPVSTGAAEQQAQSADAAATGSFFRKVA